jgi:hypothetical protein
MLVSVINGGSFIRASIRFEFILKAVRVIRGIVRKSLAQEVKRYFQDLSPSCLYRMRMPKSRLRKRMERNANSAITLRSIVEEKATEKREAATLKGLRGNICACLAPRTDSKDIHNRHQGLLLCLRQGTLLKELVFKILILLCDVWF